MNLYSAEALKVSYVLLASRLVFSEQESFEIAFKMYTTSDGFLR